MRIVCFGDSNTWGYNPVDGSRHVNRWTRVLQQLRPADEIIEAGLNGRTITAYDDKEPALHGMTALPIVMQSQNPVDIVVVMLGTNELKNYLNYSAKRISEGLEVMVKWLKNPYNWYLSTPPQILLVSPIKVHPEIATRPEALYSNMGQHAVTQSEYLPMFVEQLAAAYQVAYLDAGTVAEPSVADYIHMDEESHQSLGKAIAERIEQMIEV